MSDSVKLSFIYSSRIYTAAMYIILVPFIIAEIGKEAYGLVGFFTVLQACLGILEAGIGGVLVRQGILAKKSQSDYKKFMKIFYNVFFLFLVISFSISLAGYYLSSYYASYWFNTDIEDELLIKCCFLMFVTFSFKYLQSPHRSLLMAGERQGLISVINIVQVTISQPLALTYLIFFNGGVLEFFGFQLLSMVVSLLGMIIGGELTKSKVMLSLPVFGNTESVNSIKDMITFAIQLSWLSILWVFVTQSDKFALSKFMELADYAVFSLAVTITMSLQVLGDPINQYLLPRLTHLYSENNLKSYSSLMSKTIVYLLSIISPLVFFIFYKGEELIFVWSNDHSLASEVMNYLPLLFLGSAFGVLSNFCFLLLYSIGQLKKHTVVYMIFAVFVIPLNVLIASKYGASGVSLFFSISSGFLLVCWCGWNFKQYFEGFLFYMSRAVCPIIAISFFCFYFSSSLGCFDGLERGSLALTLFIQGVLVVVLNLAFVRFFIPVNLLKLNVHLVRQ